LKIAKIIILFRKDELVAGLLLSVVIKCGAINIFHRFFIVLDNEKKY